MKKPTLKKSKSLEARYVSTLAYLDEPQVVLLDRGDDKRIIGVAIEKEGFDYPFLGAEISSGQLQRYKREFVDLRYLFLLPRWRRWYVFDLATMDDSKIIKLTKAEEADYANDEYRPSHGFFARSHTEPMEEEAGRRAIHAEILPAMPKANETDREYEIRLAKAAITAALPHLSPDRDSELERTNEALHRELDDMTERCRTAEQRVRASIPDRDSVIEACARVADEQAERTYEKNADRHWQSQRIAAAIRALKSTDAPEKDDWRPMNTAPLDGAFRFYGVHCEHNKTGFKWFEAHYVALDDTGQLIEPSGDSFSTWGYEDFEVWADAPAPPVKGEEK